MTYVPGIRGQVEEGAQEHEYRLQQLERAEEHAHHIRTLGRKSRRWVWAILALVVIVAVLFVVYQFVAPPETALPIHSDMTG